MTTFVERLKELEERVLQYKTLQLPGQPMMTHMGTSYLIDDLLAALKDAAALSEGEMEWRPIETAPKDGTLVLVGHETAVFDGWWDENSGGWVDGSTDMYEDLIVYQPTHWMPLPASPSVKEHGNVE